jgi:hypothetical protein
MVALGSQCYRDTPHTPAASRDQLEQLMNLFSWCEFAMVVSPRVLGEIEPEARPAYAALRSQTMMQVGPEAFEMAEGR